MPTHREFSEVFGTNLSARSRTAKGVSDTSTSRQKKPLLKTGGALKAQVEENTERLIEEVWQNSRLAISPLNLELFANRWYDIINFELQDPEVYKKEHREIILRVPDSQLGRANPRFRLWNAEYTTLNLSPEEIPAAMDDFYRDFSARLNAARLNAASNREDGRQDSLLAHADHMIDSAIHPWLDGCGRWATALVMYASIAVVGFRLPRFGTREEHYANIGNLERHTDYFALCLNRET